MTAENSVDEAIRRAREAAASNAGDPNPPIDMVKAPAPAGSTSVASYQAPRAVTLADIRTGGSMNVDEFLKVKEMGLMIGTKPNIIEKIRVSIDMNELASMCFEGVRFGNPPTYYKTFDRVNCASGGSWADAVRKAQMVDPDVRPYFGADIQMTLLEDAKDLKDAVVATKGTRIGHSTAITNKANLADFIKEVEDAGLSKETVEVEVGFQARTNSKANRWGVLTFKLLGAYSAEGGE